MPDSDTIVALSSGPPPAGVAVVRLSGPRSGAVLRDSVGRLPEPRRLTLTAIRLAGEVLDSGLVAWFPGPHSFTGEDCAELHLHGSAAVVRGALRALTRLPGIRLAEAGEFTRRAFENGRLDLTEVEGLGDLIEAGTEAQRRQALARMRGGLSAEVECWRAELLGLRAEIEARLDFSDESDVDELPPDFGERALRLHADIVAAAASGTGGRIVREGARIALAGAPNVGKSSLLNALAGSDVAIVTDEPGTTRDVREVALELGGRLAILIDTAGLRETASKAEAEGVRRARAEIEGADLVLWLAAPDVAADEPPCTSAPVWRVGSKADLGPAPDAELAVSVATGEGLEALIARLTAFVTDLGGRGEPALVSRERDLAALDAAAVALATVTADLQAPELAAEDLRRASLALERLIGRVDAEAVLDRLFLSFCIGK